ncbi:MAG: FixH family protein [Candidatus Marinimicrobia bacterium]|nr:FixH family protein [Candidatus Neomarinimicrobiota bacterium]MBT3631845.1 FixH family protein [Candidatus Neomarinimicrobiota bacterium]MBT3824404.1 FixH family protein [Candidatus Neomarinimicrobiota bacterium]MBT4131084.1 FixH family protein [Candidatus Neomarinimicrobiota bacterium]MBT4295390.1 FixH family protein [Candidatus Neomarinimicrobiota bacterium]
MKLRILLIALAGSLFMILGCEDSEKEIDATEDLVLIGSAVDNGLTVDMYADQALQVGLNKLYFELTDLASDAQVTNAQITQKPIMHMETMNHSCPIAGQGSSSTSDGLFESEVVFIMASGMMGTWDDTVFVENQETNTSHQVVFESLAVLETDMKKNLVFMDADSNDVIYIVTLNGLEEPKVGLNDLIITVHKKQTMMSFPEVADLSVSINPQMPDMGHGSEGNVDPVYSENGKYEGSVAFSMTGYWTIDFTFSQGSEELGTVQYAVNF